MGGGNDFEVFDDLEVCEAFATLDMHKIIGIGHEKNKHLIEFVSDYYSTAPSTLGVYVKNQVEIISNF